MERLDHRSAHSRIEALLLEPIETSVLVIGEPGLGKSHVLDQVVRSSTIRCAQVRARPEEAAFALSGFSTVFDAIRGEHGAGFGHHLVLRSDSPDRLFAAAQDVAEMLQGLRLEPTVAVVDDLDRMDPLSQSLIGILAGRLVGTRIRIVASATSVPPDSPLTSMPSFELKALTLDQVLDVADTLAPDADPSTVRILASYVRGNPLVLAEQLARSDPHQIAGVDWLTLPPHSTAVVDAIAAPLVAALDPQDRAMLESIAMAPSGHRAAFRAEDSAADDRLEDLGGSSLVRAHGPYVSVSDTRVRMHLYWSLAARSRRERKQELGELTAPHDPHLATLYRSFRATEPDAIDRSLAAATQLVAERRLEEAIELVERALGQAHSLSDHLSAIIELSTRLLLAGEIELSDRYSNRVRWSASTADEHIALATLRFSARVISSRRIDDEEAEALVHLHAPGDQDAAGGLLAVAALYRAERWEVDAAREILAPAQDLGDTLSDTTRHKLVTMNSILDALDALTPDDADPPDDVSTNAAGLAPDILLLRGRELTWRERYAEARRVFMLVMNHPAAEDPVWPHLATYAMIANEIGAGEFHLAREAIDRWSASSSTVARGSSAHTWINAWKEHADGRFDAALEHIDTALTQSSREAHQALRARVLALRGTIRLLTNDPDSVVVDLRQVTSMSTHFRNPGLLRHWPDYVEACVLTGRVQEASAAQRALERRLRAHSTRWGQLAHARIDAMLAPDDVVVKRFSSVLGTFEKHDSPLELGRTLLVYADRLGSIGLTAESRRTRASAVAAFERCGAFTWSAHAMAGESVSMTEQTLHQLSTEEQDIAQRVRDGQRNREIAASLHLSVRTVELRLTRIYRTLGVHSRTELVGLLNEPRPPNHRT